MNNSTDSELESPDTTKSAFTMTHRDSHEDLSSNSDDIETVIHESKIKHDAADLSELKGYLYK